MLLSQRGGNVSGYHTVKPRILGQSTQILNVNGGIGPRPLSTYITSGLYVEWIAVLTQTVSNGHYRREDLIAYHLVKITRARESTGPPTACTGTV